MDSRTLALHLLEHFGLTVKVILAHTTLLTGYEGTTGEISNNNIQS